jgi:NhaP-type Na+/H+ or K+/H+ antiporter
MSLDSVMFAFASASISLLLIDFAFLLIGFALGYGVRALLSRRHRKQYFKSHPERRFFSN